MNRLIDRVNDASDSTANARAFVWAIFYAIQTGSVEDELGDGILACCNEVLSHLNVAANTLETIAEEERGRDRDATGKAVRS